MNKKEKVILAGGGGHCKVIIDAIRKAGKYEIEGIVDLKLKKGSKVLGVEVLGKDDELPELIKRGIRNVFISIGSIGDCTPRKKLYKNLRKMKFHFPVIIHSDAVIAEDVEIGEGTFIAAGAVVNPGTKIGANAIINTRSSIDHDCEIGDFVHIAPGVTLSGGVKVGSGAHMGTGANATQNASIDENKLIKAGSKVYRDAQGKTQIRTSPYGQVGDQDV